MMIVRNTGWTLTIVNDQYPDEERPVQLQDRGTPWHPSRGRPRDVVPRGFRIAEPGAPHTKFTLETAMAAIEYFQSRAANQFCDNYIIRPVE